MNLPAKVSLYFSAPGDSATSLLAEFQDVLRITVRACINNWSVNHVLLRMELRNKYEGFTGGLKRETRFNNIT